MYSMNVRNVLYAVLFMFGCLIIGFIGSLFTTPAIPGWYATLNKPSFNPPSWVFAPVWTMLYVLMGIAAYLVWSNKKDKKKSTDVSVNFALGTFAVQLFLNLLWSILFFGFQSPVLGLACIALLWVAIIVTIVQFHKFSRVAALLLLPYLLWVTFAIVLNYYLWQMN